MIDDEIKIERLAEWSKPVEVVTRYGLRFLRKATPTQEFSTAWRFKKQAVKALGAGFSKNRFGQWELTWWTQTTTEATAAKPALVIPTQQVKQQELWLNILPAEQETRLAALTPLLLPYQIPSVRQLAAALLSGGALDASDTGTGKTYVAIAVSLVLDRSIYIVCPKAIIPFWKRAAAHFKIELAGICNYELLRTGSQPELNTDNKRFEWTLDGRTLIVFDECHRMKNFNTRNCAMGLAALRQGYTVVGLSATAADNPIQMKFAGTLTGITCPKTFYPWLFQNGVRKNRFGLEFVGGEPVLNRIHHQIFPTRGTRVKIADLGEAFPETQIYAEAYCCNGVAGEIDRIYSEMEVEIAKLRASAAKDKGASILTEILRARQQVEILKIPAIAQMAEDAATEGLSVAVFVNFNMSVDALTHKLKTSCSIRGGQNARERERHVENFQTDAEQIIICNIQSGGIGVSLHGTENSRMRLAIICPTWSGQDLKQALGRVWRANGAKSIQRIFFAADTIEEEICARVKAKISRIETLNDGDLSTSGELAGLGELL